MRKLIVLQPGAAEWMEVNRMKPFIEARARDLTPETMQSQIETRGYLLVRDALPPADVKEVLRDVAQVLS